MKNDWIKELREDLIMSQEDFGKLFGVSRTTVSYWENGRQFPCFENKRKLKELYEIRIIKKV